ncbi:peptidylprolyl isomerase [Zobellella denitrificans]|jgi:FKBP-type peptidyl-prolyl cis-trans isomerase SlyD|uniref:Peptidyl-prolyl cis-trans isomerase n=1 Tax=Zobellella denitrificans TaxID=347534 RepID=A0A231MV69_9GAMM|nr:peptidylprolyl isomerase [Zobellella denitrificans]ATG72502.1 peptidylprolyl isomerase [Zobellella denitrificans]OXS13899.1 peptidylprolyl isomerase [Zobellella denitrificans]
MQITDNTVVQFNYTLKGENGEVLESNAGQSPLAYLHGHRNMMAGVEKALAGREAGERFSVTLPAAEAYGERKDGLTQRVPVKHLTGAARWRPGMTAVVHTDQGHRQVTVLKVGKFMAEVDLNHPLAGRTLTFELEVVAVRPASEEEIAHGHAHGEGGHHH